MLIKRRKNECGYHAKLIKEEMQLSYRSPLKYTNFVYFHLNPIDFYTFSFL